MEFGKLDLRKYIGKSYEKYNCLDLVKEFYLEFFNLEVKNYYEGEVPDRREVQSLINTNRGDFIQVDKELFGDLVLIRLYGLECHLGVYLGRGQFLHSIRGTGSGIERVSKYKHMLAGYYRHRRLPR